MKININQAKTHFSRLLQRVASGEEVTIARAGVPVARLVPPVADQTARPMGMDRDALKIADDFDAPLPAGMLAHFLGGSASKPKRNKKKPPRRP